MTTKEKLKIIHRAGREREVAHLQLWVNESEETWELWLFITSRPDCKVPPALSVSTNNKNSITPAFQGLPHFFKWHQRYLSKIIIFNTICCILPSSSVVIDFNINYTSHYVIVTDILLTNITTAFNYILIKLHFNSTYFQMHFQCIKMCCIRIYYITKYY